MTSADPEPLTGLDVPPDILDLDVEEFRRLGHWMVDRTVEHLTTLRDRSAITTGDAAVLAGSLGGPLPGAGAPVDEGLRLMIQVALESQQHGDHPRYFARVPGPSSQVAILGDWLATGFQAISSSWGGGSGTATLEITALGWLRDALGLAPASEGVLTSGGSMANLTGLIVARAERGPGVVYLSDQTHSSIGRGARAIGWPADRVRVLPTHFPGVLPPGLLASAIEADLAAGLAPTVVVATAGTTNTGAVDDLAALASICRRHGVWLHVDGAYGGPAALVTDRVTISGLELADSFVLDPHKWLFQPYDIGCLWVAHPGALERTFAMHPEYLRDTQTGAVNLHNRTLELSRRTRAAKLWLTLRSYGLDRLASAISRTLALAEEAQRLIEDRPILEIVTPAQLGIVTFAVRGADADRHAEVVAAINADGFAALTGTVVDGRSALRLCIINPRTTIADLAGTIERIAAAAR